MKTMHNGWIRSLLATVLAIMTLAGGVSAATRTWTGLGGNTNASTAGNWSPNGAPIGTDDIVLDASSSNMTWDAAATNTVASWSQTAAYTGTVTFATTYTNVFTNFTISGNAAVSNGVWTHGDNSTYGTGNTNYYCLSVAVGGNFTLGSSAQVNADLRGYKVGQGPGKGTTWQVAPSHGGQGGKQSNNSGAEGFKWDDIAFPPVYGAIRQPTTLGSGGGETGNGGGAVRLVVTGASQLDGKIRARGGLTAAGTSGNGAGGSIWLQTGTLGGTGEVDVAGGDNGRPKCGGGGRIAVVVTNGATIGSVVCKSFGGAGESDIGGKGAAGTVYIETTANTAGNGRLIVDNNNSGIGNIPSTVIMEPLTNFAQVVITNTGCIALRNYFPYDFATSTNISGGGEVRVQNATNVVFPATFVITNSYRLALDVPIVTTGNWTIANGGVLTHGSVAYVNLVNTYTLDPATKLFLTLQGDLTINAGGSINVDSKGHGVIRGPGAGKDAHQTAASHGGQGGTYSGLIPSPTYDSLRNPFLHGCGGGESSFGGGVVRLDVSGATTLAGGGFITAKGVASASSGGAIWLRTGTLTGPGTLDASGGPPSDSARSSGGGGRIALIVTNDTTIGSVGCLACGGSGTVGNDTQRGAAGTVYVQTSADVANGGAVVVDNTNMTASSISVTPLPAFSNSVESLTTTRWTAQNRGKIGLVTNVTVASVTLNSNSYLELAGYTGTVSTLTITNGSIRPGTYAAAALGALVTDNSPGATGRMVVLGAFNGSVFKFR